jgi:predicted metal-dependent hydrolase
MNTIQFGKHTIEYKLTTSKQRKTLSIAVDQHGVSVTSPIEVPIEKIESTLYKKATWIVKQLDEFSQMNKGFQRLAFISGEKLPYLGRQYRLKIIKSDETQPSFRFYQGHFLAHLPNHIPQESHLKILHPLYVEWIKQRALEFSLDRIKRFTLKLQQEPKKVIIKEQDQRWGSCTASGNILLNWRIFLAPTSIIDYVLAHELAHLKHLNHSKEYWETLQMLLPDYEQRKEWLKINGGTLNV